MGSTPKRHLITLTIISFFFATGFLGDGWEYDLQSIPEPSGAYEIYPNGIVAMHTEHGEIYLKPANDIWLKSTSRLLGLVPLGSVKPEDPFSYIDSGYYHEALDQKRRPEFFVVEVMFINSNAGLTFDPYDNGVILGTQRTGLAKYAVIDTSQRSSTRGRHSRPYKRGYGFLFGGAETVEFPISGPLAAGQVGSVSVGSEIAQIALSPSMERREFALPATTGFVLAFDCAPPVPGKDTFTLQLHGLRAQGVPVHQQDLRFTQTQQNQVYRH